MMYRSLMMECWMDLLVIRLSVLRLRRHPRRIWHRWLGAFQATSRHAALIIQCWRHSLLPTIHGDASLYASLYALRMLLSPLSHHSPVLSLPKLMLCLDIWRPTRHLPSNPSVLLV